MRYGHAGRFGDFAVYFITLFRARPGILKGLLALFLFIAAFFPSAMTPLQAAPYMRLRVMPSGDRAQHFHFPFLVPSDL
jgi:hypothetical protein